MTPEELQRIAAEELQARQHARHRIGVCTASGCLSCGSREVLTAIKQEAADKPEMNLRVEGVGCMGLCSRGPLVWVQTNPPPTETSTAASADASPTASAPNLPDASPDDSADITTDASSDRPTGASARAESALLYKQLTPDDAPTLIATLAAAPASPTAAAAPPATTAEQTSAQDSTQTSAQAPATGDHPLAQKICDPAMPFFKRQVKVVLDQFENIDPERLESYLAADGYLALLDCLHHRRPPEIIDEITRSGLRGRGGGGYPTGLKWSTVAKASAFVPQAGQGHAGSGRQSAGEAERPDGPRKYVICNADEGDPGAFMDRSVLESAPHRVLEGMAIAAYAVGADFGYIYVRAEYPLAVERLRKAIGQAEKQGLLGRNIGGSDFNFQVEIRLGAGAFVCGEETALLASIEGRRGQPRPRPPYPAEHGLWGCPTLINNVETFANVAAIINRGADWFASLGTDKSKGTKVFALAGKVANTGLIEVPMGISLTEIVNEMGGGTPDEAGGAIKAVQTGGPSGGCIPAAHFNLPVDYESLQAEGSIMGSGGMIIMDDTAAMVDVARFFMEFCVEESCGKCTPCRVGTKQVLLLLEKIGRGEGRPADLTQLEELCHLLQQTSLCGLGQSAANPVLSTLRFFRREYVELLAGEEEA
ncbi:NuoF family protein [Desulfurivibrio dismutans]|uniref:NuoF family protein n=1 Tax=Desulfurivibrio dismutans TaxID=1398908 RepID=UPI0023DB989D|nr:NADH-ubiquinone oxidoreductase-F iron-sulfur binding region domain-containing protein [Desulfurivibrio alkaliphilus]MDF1613495.1 NADH-ubiquinone oxidoreductase-F iron-sulfur binding region domain-containing protein [Desulfurivibrio alkaliphilus]